MKPTIRKLTAAAFAPFGDVIEASRTKESHIINQGYTQRFHDLAKIDVANNDGRIAVNIFRSQPLPAPINICRLERHPLSSQMFMPLSGLSYLVVVAPPGDLNEAQIQVFQASANQGVNYRAGTWHHFCLALYEQSDFLVIDRIGAGADCDQVTLQAPIKIDIARLDKGD